MGKMKEYFREMKLTKVCSACRELKCCCDELQELEWKVQQIKDKEPKWK